MSSLLYTPLSASYLFVMCPIPGALPVPTPIADGKGKGIGNGRGKYGKGTAKIKWAAA